MKHEFARPLIAHASDATATPRRGFLGRLAAGLAAIAVSMPRSAAAAPGSASAGGGEEWMEALKGKHRAVLDVAAHREGKPLAQAKNYLDAWRDAFGAAPADVNLVLGVHGEGLPLVLSDALWARYRIGEQYQVRDSSTKSPAVRNVFTAAHVAPDGPVTAEQTIEALQRRGVRVLICQNTILGASRKLSAAGMGAADEIRQALLGGLLPGVIVVPAMVVTLTQLQERGIGYVKVA